MNTADKDPRVGAARNASPLGSPELVEIATRTIGHYDAKAEQFWEQTRDHDVTQNRNCLLRHIESDPPFTILDLGCGGGRDRPKVDAVRARVALGFMSEFDVGWVVGDDFKTANSAAYVRYRTHVASTDVTATEFGLQAGLMVYL